ncbi:MAG: phosphatase PAP2 family protein [Planctomycetes bacterium]|nr:phosphatase PAP2 family protein [Planctomycetota bacterium]
MDRQQPNTAAVAHLSLCGRWWIWCAALAAASAVALWFDVPLARWSIDESSFRFLAGLFHVAETFGNGIGVVIIVVAVAMLDPAARRSIGWLLGASIGSGLAADLLKLLIGRMRPRHWLDPRQNLSPEALDTFVGWLPFGQGGSGLQSFPSAHTATAVGLALGLSAIYPRGRVLFFALAALVAAQRVTSDAHHLSDVLAGAAVACLIAPWCVGKLRMMNAEC